ncbi:hypothetical protein [Amorphus sp. MBR-141]
MTHESRDHGKWKITRRRIFQENGKMVIGNGEMVFGEMEGGYLEDTENRNRQCARCEGNAAFNTVPALRGNMDTMSMFISLIILSPLHPFDLMLATKVVAVAT